MGQGFRNSSPPCIRPRRLPIDNKTRQTANGRTALQTAHRTSERTKFFICCTCTLLYFEMDDASSIYNLPPHSEVRGAWLLRLDRAASRHRAPRMTDARMADGTTRYTGTTFTHEQHEPHSRATSASNVQRPVKMSVRTGTEFRNSLPQCTRSIDKTRQDKTRQEASKARRREFPPDAWVSSTEGRACARRRRSCRERDVGHLSRARDESARSAGRENE